MEYEQQRQIILILNRLERRLTRIAEALETIAEDRVLKLELTLPHTDEEKDKYSRADSDVDED